MKGKDKWMFFLVSLLIRTVLKYGIKNQPSPITQVNNYKSSKILTGHMKPLKSLKKTIKYLTLVK